MDTKRFGDLAPDGHDGIEGSHGFLEDHGDVLSAVAAHGVFREGEQVLAHKANVSSDLGGVGKEAEKGEGGGGFAGAGLSDQAESLAGVDLKGDISDGGVGPEVDGKVFDFEKRRVHP